MTSILKTIRLAELKARLSLKAETSSSYLNYLWWVIEPAVEFAVFYFVFTFFFVSPEGNFAIFLLSGLVGWSWFSKSITNVSQALLNGSWLLDHIKISPIFFPLVIFFQDAVKSLVMMLIYIAVMIIIGEASINVPLLVATICLMGLFIFSFGFFLATILPLIPDLRHLIPTGIMIAMFCSGVFFDANQIIPPEKHKLFFINPLASGLAMFRYSLAEIGAPNLSYATALISWSAGFFLMGLAISNKLRDGYALMLKR